MKTYQELLRETDPILTNQQKLAIFQASGTRPVFVRDRRVWTELYQLGIIDEKAQLTERGKEIFNDLNKKKEVNKRIKKEKKHLTT